MASLLGALALGPVFAADDASLDGRQPPAPGAEQPLDAPADRWAAQTSATQITLVWQAVPGAAGYNLYFDSTKEPRPAQHLAANVTRYVTPVTALGQPHAYSIEAFDAQGRRAPRAPFTLVLPVAAPPGPVAPPPHVSAEPMGTGELLVSWEPVPDATAYRIAREVSPGSLQTLCDLCPTDGSFVDRLPVPGASHVYLVSALAPNGRSAPTRSNAVVPRGGQPAASRTAPRDATAVIEVKLNWPRVPGARELRIERAGGSKEGFTPLATLPGDATRYVDHLAAPLSQLAYRIIAIDSGGASAAVPFAFR